MACIRLPLMRFYIRIGTRSNVMTHVEVWTASVRKGSVLVGNHSIINRGCILDGRGGRVVIGDNVDIAFGTAILTLEHDPHSDDHVARGADVVVEDYAWIAARATILPGVKIGRGAVVAAGAVVTKDVAPMDIVAGVPARKIGVRKSNLSYTLNHFPWFA